MTPSRPFSAYDISRPMSLGEQGSAALSESGDTATAAVKSRKQEVACLTSVGWYLDAIVKDDAFQCSENAEEICLSLCAEVAWRALAGLHLKGQ